MQIKILGLVVLMTAGLTASAEADPVRPKYYRYQHCGSCQIRTTTDYKWELRTFNKTRREVSGYRKELVRWDRQFAGWKKVYSHTEWRWVIEKELRGGYVYRLWKKKPFKKHKNIKTYRNVPIYTNIPVYKTSQVRYSKWVEVPVRSTYWICHR